ncbi:MAG: hypothetical protein EON59_03210 [Alphaproteobacteria bacterium]|nr:MAG: hypothetical protein EON59_03210 [Alphaproteobacteria bacterium]
MFDTNWELISGDVAHEIEVLNQSSQINLIEAIVRFFLHHYAEDGASSGHHPNQNALCELHRTATFLLLAKPGIYRDGPVHLAKPDGTIMYVPPAAEDVAAHMERLFQQVTDCWEGLSPVEMGSFTLWLINWVHPFKNGNGRTARAFCYTCICLRMGFVLPGAPTVLELIKMNDEEYQEALRVADKGYDETGNPDLSKMNAFIERLVIEQLTSAVGG